MTWVDTVRGMSGPQIVRAVWRKFIFRRASMGMYEVRASDARPIAPVGWEFEIRSADHVSAEDLHNPYLSQADLDEFRHHPAAVCLLARKGSETAGSLWALQQTAFIHELGREIPLTPGTHYLCRAFVRPEYQGHALHAAMLYEYGRRQSPDSIICGLMYDWNVAAIRNAQKVGWTRTGTYWSVWVLGLRLGGARRSHPA